MTVVRLHAQPITAGFGAVLEGIDLSHDITHDDAAAIHDAVVTHGVVVVRNQPIDDDQQLALARHWGELQVYAPFRCAGMDVPLEWVEDNEASPPKAFRWHSDIPWEPRPPKFGMLSAKVVPDAGGDTVWADTAAAYDALSPTMQQLLCGLQVHYKIEANAMERIAGLVDVESAARFKNAYARGVEHPLVRRNPDSDRVALFMAGYWMDHIVGMHRDESDALLRFLHDHAVQPRFQCRWRWAVDDLVVWDERRTMHLALPDHYPRHRKLRRCTVVGEVPLAPT
ncbi:MAG: TauD/TfdA family dioxygenase [Acidimicrobiales bacterium]